MQLVFSYHVFIASKSSNTAENKNWFKIRSPEMHFPALWGRTFLFSQPQSNADKRSKKHMHCCEKSEMHDLRALSHKLHDWSFLLYLHSLV